MEDENAGFCPQCGHENPARAHFCMNCGAALDERLPAEGGRAGQWPSVGDEGVNWATVVAAALAFWGLLRASRKARGMAVMFTLVMLFFGCPMACGLVAFAVETFAGLFR